MKDILFMILFLKHQVPDTMVFAAISIILLLINIITDIKDHHRFQTSFPESFIEVRYLENKVDIPKIFLREF